MAADFEALAKKLIDVNGRTISIINLNETPPDPNKPWRGQADPTSGQTAVTGKGAFVPLGGSDLGHRFSESDPDDQVCLFPAADDQGFPLEDFDEILDNTTRWQIKETQVLQPGNSRFLYFFRVAQ